MLVMAQAYYVSCRLGKVESLVAKDNKGGP